MINDLENAVSKMPDNWWKIKNWCDLLAQTLRGFVLGLMLAGNINGDQQATVFSGFLWKHEKFLFWITAGHVLDNINSIVNSDSSTALIGRWLDWEDGATENTIPVDLNSLCIPSSNSFPQDKSFIDLGIVMLTLLESGLILSNHTSIPFSEINYEELHEFNPEGFILLGYPNQLNSAEWRRESTGNSRVRMTSSLLAIPIDRIPFSPDYNFDKKDPNAFYGKIVDFPEFKDNPLNIVGMSGGPILAVKRDKTKGIDYRVVAIQHGWLTDSRIIQAEPIKRVINLFEYVENQQEN